MKAPFFDVDLYLVHNDLPTKEDLVEVEKNEQMMITLLVLPVWIEIWEMTPKLRKSLEESFLGSRGIPRSHRHAVFFCSHGSNVDELFEEYKKQTMEDVSKPMGFTMIGGSNVSEL